MKEHLYALSHQDNMLSETNVEAKIISIIHTYMGMTNLGGSELI